jgi:hypothetical protein
VKPQPPGDSRPSQTAKEKLAFRCLIQTDARLLNELRSRVHDAPSGGDPGRETQARHTAACAEFDARYDALAFPGGYEKGLGKLRENDPETIDAALAFLEVRPYFFRSQFIATKLRRMVKRATLNMRQKERLESVQSPSRVAQS